MARLGTVQDGGKWVCNPQYLLREKCTAYSIGGYNEISFEQDFQMFTGNGCKLRAVDKVCFSPLIWASFVAISGLAATGHFAQAVVY